MADKGNVGRIGWHDITVDDAPALRDFYAAVIGWTVEDTSMGDYSYYTMITPHSGEAVGGVCHARGSNTGLPAQWLMYLTVEDLDASIEACLAKGGKVVRDPDGLMGGRFAVISDPVGAVVAIYQEP